MNINTSRLEKLGIIVPEILLPDTTVAQDKWAIIACDQHTSDREYWKLVEQHRKGSPSTLDLVFPEVYLEDDDSERRIGEIQKNMERYLRDGLLRSHGRGWVYVERRTDASGLRQGIVLAVDLEKYDFSMGSTSLIRATEGTILERLPPRIRIREKAGIELPHIMILIDDREKNIIETLAEKTSELEKIYDLDLMLDGGNLKGYWIDDSEIINRISGQLETIASPEVALERYGNETPLLFAMGDGNHSLATAKSVWEAMKKEHLAGGGSIDDIADHPARYALAEIVNIYSPGLRFEPIHRVLFDVNARDFFSELAADPGLAANIGSSTVRELAGEQQAREYLEAHKNAAAFYTGGRWYALDAEPDELAPAVIDRSFHRLEDKQTASGSNSGKIDFIHGWEHSIRIADEVEGRVAVFFNVIPREELFSYVINHGALPRKAFSMGDAEEKRYYFEARRVR